MSYCCRFSYLPGSSNKQGLSSWRIFPFQELLIYLSSIICHNVINSMIYNAKITLLSKSQCNKRLKTSKSQCNKRLKTSKSQCVDTVCFLLKSSLKRYFNTHLKNANHRSCCFSTTFYKVLKVLFFTPEFGFLQFYNS